MSIRFLGTSTQYNNSPTLFVTEHGSYLVQGWRVEGRETAIEIPHRLLAFLEPGTCLNVRLEDTGRGTFVLSGTPVTDPGLLAGIDVPEHEQLLEVAMGVEIRPDDRPLAREVG